MKLLIFAFSILSLITLNGCFVYQNTISWEQQPNKAKDYAPLEVGFVLSQSQRFLTLPFLFVNYSKKKELYAPILHLTTIDSARSLINFRFAIYDFNGNKILSDSIGNAVLLNKILDYKALSYDFKREYLISGLEEKAIGDTININFELTLIYSNGSKQTSYFKNKNLVKTRKKSFGSFL